jgi:hypothetical protein
MAPSISLAALAALAGAFVVPGPVAPRPVDPAAAAYYAVAPGYYAAAPGFLARSDVVMNTQYGDPNVLAMKKKNPKTGSSNMLKGYTVGSRAPPVAKASGTTAQFGYGINNLYGGGQKSKLSFKDQQKSGKLLGGSGASYTKSGLDPKGLGPIFVWVGLIIAVGSYFKFAA